MKIYRKTLLFYGLIISLSNMFGGSMVHAVENIIAVIEDPQNKIMAAPETKYSLDDKIKFTTNNQKLLEKLKKLAKFDLINLGKSVNKKISKYNKNKKFYQRKKKEIDLLLLSANDFIKISKKGNNRKIENKNKVIAKEIKKVIKEIQQTKDISFDKKKFESIQAFYKNYSKIKTKLSNNRSTLKKAQRKAAGVLDKKVADARKKKEADARKKKEADARKKKEADVRKKKEIATRKKKESAADKKKEADARKNKAAEKDSRKYQKTYELFLKKEKNLKDYIKLHSVNAKWKKLSKEMKVKVDVNTGHIEIDAGNIDFDKFYKFIKKFSVILANHRKNLEKHYKTYDSEWKKLDSAYTKFNKKLKKTNQNNYDSILSTRQTLLHKKQERLASYKRYEIQYKKVIAIADKQKKDFKVRTEKAKKLKKRYTEIVKEFKKAQKGFKPPKGLLSKNKAKKEGRNLYKEQKSKLKSLIEEFKKFYKKGQKTLSKIPKTPLSLGRLKTYNGAFEKFEKETNTKINEINKAIENLKTLSRNK